MKNIITSQWYKLPKYLRFNLVSWLVYTIPIYLLLLPLWIFDIKFLIVNIPISIILGFFFSCLNTIIYTLRQLNGEKFPNLEESDENDEEKVELIKS